MKKISNFLALILCFSIFISCESNMSEDKITNQSNSISVKNGRLYFKNKEDLSSFLKNNEKISENKLISNLKENF